MVDTNHAYNAMTAVRLARGIEPYDITWLEEPVPPEDLEEMCIRDRSDCGRCAG